MSLFPILWALKSAPVADAEERIILMVLAERAWSDGTDAFPSKSTIAESALIDPRTVQRRLKSLVDRKVIAKGNQDAASYIPEWSRPTVYDLLIPYSWFSDIDQVNAERRGRGKAPLTPGDRPDLAEAPVKKKRSDKGKRRPKKTAATTEGGGDCKSPPDKTDQTGQEGETTSPPGGDYKSAEGGLVVSQPSPANPPQDPPRPSGAPDEHGDRTGDGGMDGGGDSQQQKDAQPPAATVTPATPGVEVLLAIGMEQPEFLLTGQTLRDQGMLVTGMLASGWTAQHIRHIVAGRPLPQPVHTSVGAIVSKRLQDAAGGPAPGSVPRLPAQPPHGPYGGFQDEPTPTARRWEDQAAEHALDIRPGECNGDDGLCGRPTVPGYDQCPPCLGWAPCEGCYTHRTPEGRLCDSCAMEPVLAGEG